MQVARAFSTSGPSDTAKYVLARHDLLDDEDEGEGERIRQISTSAKDVDIAGLGAPLDDNGTEKEDARTLGIVFALMVVVGLGNKVLNKEMTIPMHNYPNFLNLLTTFVFIPVCFFYIIPAVRWGYIPAEQLTFDKKKSFFVMGGLDGIAGILQTFSATYLDGPLLILLGQAAIPVSMVLSKLLLKAKYSGFQYLGAAIVVGGLFIVLSPTLSGSGGSLLWAAMMIVSCIPMALSSVYKEIALGETELDPVYLNGWIAAFQFGFALLFCVPASLATSPPVPIPDLPENLWNGMRCYIGIDSLTCPEGSSSDCVPDNCSSSPLYVNLYLLFNQAYNLLIILILKYGSANLLFLALTLQVPLGNAAFTLPFLPGHKPLQFTDIIGLVVICVGLICYRFSAQILALVGVGKGQGIDGVDHKPLLSSVQQTSDEDRI